MHFRLTFGGVSLSLGTILFFLKVKTVKGNWTGLSALMTTSHLCISLHNMINIGKIPTRGCGRWPHKVEYRKEKNSTKLLKEMPMKLMGSIKLQAPFLRYSILFLSTFSVELSSPSLLNQPKEHALRLFFFRKSFTLTVFLFSLGVVLMAGSHVLFWAIIPLGGNGKPPP